MPVNIAYLDNNSTKKEEYSLTYDKRGFIKTETAYPNYSTIVDVGPVLPPNPPTYNYSANSSSTMESQYYLNNTAANSNSTIISPPPIDISTGTTVNKTYSYDEIGRLLSVVNSSENKITSYTYDKVGNRLTMSGGSDSFSYSYNQFNSLLELKKNGVVDSTFTYDKNGNQITETAGSKTTTFGYDKADRLINLTIANGTSTKNIANYYNGDGQRIKQIEDGVATKYYYDGDSLFHTADINNNKGQEHILEPSGSIVASKRFDGSYSNMYFFYNYDIRGSVTSIIKPDGSLVKGYDYDEFGKTKDSGDSLFKNDTKFTGAVHDASSNLYYMNSRFYNPNTGRFLTQDTYAGNPYESWTQHLYSYTSNNPINYVDPTGHRSTSISDGNGGIAANDENVGDAEVGGQISSGGFIQRLNKSIEFIRSKFIKPKMPEAVITKDIAAVEVATDTSQGTAEAKTYYHVTTEEAAAKIMESSKLGKEGNTWESRVFVWSEQPTKGQAKAAGIGSRTQTVLKFNSNASFEPDAGIVNPSIKNITLQSTDTQRIPINIQSVESVGFKPRWWEFWKK